MMRVGLQLLLAAVVASSVAGCGYRGKLKTPTQIQVHEEKKQRKAAGKDVKQSPEEEAQKASSPLLSDGNGEQQDDKVNLVVTPSNNVAK